MKVSWSLEGIGYKYLLRPMKAFSEDIKLYLSLKLTTKWLQTFFFLSFEKQ